MLEFLASKRLFLVHLTLILLSAWLVFNWYGAVQRLIASYLPVPQMDYWRVVVDYPEIVFLLRSGDSARRHCHGMEG